MILTKTSHSYATHDTSIYISELALECNVLYIHDTCRVKFGPILGDWIYLEIGTVLPYEVSPPMALPPRHLQPHLPP